MHQLPAGWQDPKSYKLTDKFALTHLFRYTL
jgi:hypothetical protein